jgi:hydroxyacylglutathione hydrolase
MSDIKVINLGTVNAYVLIGEKYVLVDTGMKGSEKKILEALRRMNIDPTDIGLIVLTHGHADHTGSVDTLAKITGAKVLVHKLEYDIMANHLDDEVVAFNIFAKFILWTGTKLDKKQPSELDYKADIFIEDTFGLSEYGVKGSIIHTPGHTKGSISILMDNGDVILGDHLMAMMPWSKPGKPMLAYSLSKVKESIDMLIDMGVKHFYLSHGKDYPLEVIQGALKKLEA